MCCKCDYCTCKRVGSDYLGGEPTWLLAGGSVALGLAVLWALGVIVRVLVRLLFHV